MKNPMQVPYIPPNVDFPDDAAKQGIASWAADSTEVVFKVAAIGGGGHEDTSSYTTKKEKKVFHYQVTNQICNNETKNLEV